MIKPEVKARLKIIIPIILYKIIGILFIAHALLNCLFVLSFLRRGLFIFSLIYAGYLILDVIMAYGFLKMKKWLIPLLGGAIIVMGIVLNLIFITRGTQTVSKGLFALAFFGALFALTYFSRKFLNGGYKNFKVFSLFLLIIILIQALTFLLK